MKTQTVLVVDVDLGHQFWLAQLLADAGYRVLPAGSVSQAMHMVDQFALDISVLVINPVLVGSTDFTRRLRRRQAQLRVVAILDSDCSFHPTPSNADCVVAKPDGHTDLKELARQWLTVLRHLL